jgi:hypothetical protein
VKTATVACWECDGTSEEIAVAVSLPDNSRDGSEGRW